MTISEEINAIRDKYKPKNIHYDRSKFCKQPYYDMAVCIECGLCGREFKDGILVKEATSERTDK